MPPALPRSVVREAAQWLMQLHSGQATEAQRQAWTRWRAADPAHELAWQRAEQLSAKLELLPPAASRQVLDRPRPGRRAAVGTLGLLATAVPGGLLAWRGWDAWGPAWTASHRTAAGERRSVDLADGTRLVLNTATAVDVLFHDGAPGERLLVLHHGEILVETGPDGGRGAAPHRPFVVQTRHGRIRALGTRFVVRQLSDAAEPARTLVTVHQGAVAIAPAGTAGQQPEAIVRAGEQTQFDSGRVDAVAVAGRHAAAWVQGLLFASDQPLGAFIAELARYRSGVLRCAPQVAGLRISGAFRLDDTDAILAALPATLPVRVVWRTRWWVGIAAA